MASGVELIARGSSYWVVPSLADRPLVHADDVTGEFVLAVRVFRVRARRNMSSKLSEPK